MANKQIPTEGQVFISVDGNRLKQHPGNTVYLDNGREFQLEVFNPTTSKVLAKIKINGSYISSSGLVLKPGQRVFLERYLDMAKKFKFETYSVDNSPETVGAIANNGTVEVEFYNEYVVPQQVYIPYTQPIWTTLGGCFGTTAGGYNSCFTTTSGNLGDITTSNVNMNINSTNVVNTSYTSSSNIGQASSSSSLSAPISNDSSLLGRKMSKKSDESSLSFASMDSLMDFGDVEFERSIAAPEKKETGRVESGSHSNQSFVTDYATYNSFYSNKVSWKILPLSQKPVEVSDLKTYCPNCRTRIKKKSWKYCPTCSEEL